MKSLFDPAQSADMIARIDRLRADSPRLWGKMTAPQMLAHCSVAMEYAVGDHNPPRMFIGRIMGGFIKRLAIGNDKPMARNSPTAPGLLITGDRDFAAEHARLRGLVARFASAGAAGCTTHPHTFFGRMRPDEWGILMYKHTDHHLRQFSA